MPRVASLWAAIHRGWGPELSPVWRAYGSQAYMVGGPSCPPPELSPPELSPCGEPMDRKLPTSVVPAVPGAELKALNSFQSCGGLFATV